MRGILHMCRVRWPCPYDEGDVLMEGSGSGQGLSTQSMLETGTTISIQWRPKVHCEVQELSYHMSRPGKENIDVGY